MAFLAVKEKFSKIKPVSRSIPSFAISCPSKPLKLAKVPLLSVVTEGSLESRVKLLLRSTKTSAPRM